MRQLPPNSPQNEIAFNKKNEPSSLSFLDIRHMLPEEGIVKRGIKNTPCCRNKGLKRNWYRDNAIWLPSAFEKLIAESV